MDQAFESNESPVVRGRYFREGSIDGLVVYGGDSSDEESDTNSKPSVPKKPKMPFTLKPIKVESPKSSGNKGRLKEFLKELNCLKGNQNKISPLKKFVAPKHYNTAAFSRLTSSDPGSLSPGKEELKRLHLKQPVENNLSKKKHRTPKPESLTPKNSSQIVRKSLKDTAFFKLVITKAKTARDIINKNANQPKAAPLGGLQTATPRPTEKHSGQKPLEENPKPAEARKPKKKTLHLLASARPKQTVCPSSRKTLQSVLNSAKSIRHSTGTAIGLAAISGFKLHSEPSCSQKQSLKNSLIQVPETGNSKPARHVSKLQATIISNFLSRLKESRAAPVPALD